MIVIYAEKYSLGRTIAEALGAYKKTVNPKESSIAHWDLNLNGEQAILCHGAGHLCGLAPAEDYDERYKFWSFDNYPIIPEHFITRVKDNNYSRLACDYVKQFFDKADLIINATDADREGELIFAYLYEVLHCTVPYKRVWITDLTPCKIRKAFAKLRSAQEMKPLENAGRIRSATDWLVGINTSVAATLKFGGADNVFACGRVKMPTLAMIVKREREIRNYIKKPFYKIVANIEANDGAKFTAEAADKYDTETAAKTAIDEIKSNTAKAIKVEVSQKQTAAPLLYNTTHLLADLSKCTDLTIDMLTKLVQSLYENRLITYPRTSSEHLTDAMKDETVKIIKLLFEMPEFAKYAIPVDKFAPCTRRHYDDSKVDSHTAITPTALVPNDLSGMSENERKAYTLLALSIIRTVYPKAVTENIKAVFQIDNQLFTAIGTNIINPGWFAVDATPEVTGLPEIVKDNDYKVIGFDVKEGQNEPPKYYTDATLLTAMELAGNNITDEQTRSYIKLTKRGLGTAATRQGIIKELYDNKVKSDYTRIDRNVFNKKLSASELRLYILIMKSIDSKLGYCFKSFNDLADELNIKRDTAMKIVSNLVNLHLVRKQRKMRYDNRKVYADNSYSLKVIKLIKKRNKPGLHSGLISFKNILKHTDNPTIAELNSLRNYNNAIGSICQVGQGYYSVIFFKSRGSPPNLRSIQYPVILPSERQNIFYIRI